MLVLTRKSGEAIRIGDSVSLTILEIKGNQVRIGIDAPDDVVVYREEVYQVVLEQNTRAASSAEPAGIRLDLNSLLKGIGGKGES